MLLKNFLGLLLILIYVIFIFHLKKTMCTVILVCLNLGKQMFAITGNIDYC